MEQNILNFVISFAVSRDKNQLLSFAIGQIVTNLMKAIFSVFSVFFPEAESSRLLYSGSVGNKDCN